MPLVVGCAPKSDGWKRAKSEHTPEAYRRFVRAEPKDKMAASALERMEKLDWEHAENVSTSKGWGVYLSYHPDSPRAEQARASMEDVRWQEALNANTKARYQIFLSNHGDSPHASEASDRLDDLEFIEAQDADSAESYGLYLDRHFQGKHAEQARKLYEDRIWQTVITADTFEAYQDFAERFPEGRYATHCAELLETYTYAGLALLMVSRKAISNQSQKSLKNRFRRPLEAALKKEKLPFKWLPMLDARSRPGLDPLEGLELPEGWGVMVIDVEEVVGRPFYPRGNATDIHASVHLVPIKMTPMKTVKITASTRGQLQAESLAGLLSDAQADFAEKLAVVPIGWSQWLVKEEAEK